MRQAKRRTVSSVRVLDCDTIALGIKIFILEYKVKPVKAQIQAIEEAIRTTQFVRNKVLRYGMDKRLS